MIEENIYEKMKRWGDEKKANDDFFWNEAYPNMDEASKLVYWRKDVFNAIQNFGKNNIPQEWISERKKKDPDFEVLFKKVVDILSS